MKYLLEAEHAEAMAAWAVRDGPEPVTHKVFTHDFMAMAKHDIPCVVCFDSKAVIERDVTPGRFRQTVQPCHSCQSRGWRVRQSIWSRLFGGEGV